MSPRRNGGDPASGLGSGNTPRLTNDQRQQRDHQMMLHR
jgi:hypothetical protein